MATLKNRLEALEAMTPAGNANYCLVMHSDEDCAKARNEAIAEYTALYGIAPVNFINITFVKPGDKSGACQCKKLEGAPFTVTGPGARAIMADLVEHADGTALPVVKDPVQ